MSPISRPFIFLFLSLVCHTSAAPYFLYNYCPNNTFFPATDSALQLNLDNLLSNLSAAANSSSSTSFHTSTVGVGVGGTVYGLYLCRGDEESATCMECVGSAVAELTQNCPRGKQAVTWYDECMIRYSNESFFGKLDANFHLLMWNTQNITGNAVTRFNEVLGAALAKVASGAVSGGSMVKFDTEEDKFNKFQSVYALGQCTPDLSGSDCYQCLQQCISSLPGRNRQGGRVLYFSCNLRYEIYLFYSKMALATPTWLRTECPSTEEAAYASNIKTLLYALSFAANQSGGFYNDTIGGNTPTTVYGLYLCHGNITASRRRDCVATASNNLATNCSNGKQAVALYGECMIRYLNESFFGHLYPNLHLYTSNTTNKITDAAFNYGMGYARGKVSEAVKYEAANKDGKMFATDVESINSTGYNVYTVLGQL